MMSEDQGEKRAVLVADVSGTPRTGNLTDDEAIKFLETTTLGHLQESVHNQEGQVIIAEGDELICVFDAAEQAADAAVEMQVTNDLGSIDDGPSSSLPIRIGFQWGVAKMDGDRISGPALHEAFRLAEAARGGQILTTMATGNVLSPMVRDTLRPVAVAPFSSRDENAQVVELVWKHDEVSQMLETRFAVDTVKRRLVLTIDERRYTVFEEAPRFVIGRSRRADLQVNRDSISREHVEVRCENGEFIVKDISTNGTYIVMDGDTKFLQGDALVLSETGIIFPGDAPVESTSVAIEFVIEADQPLA